ncbi:hypothetical protein DEH69_20790 [Streptomyces sp. PT12]|nr:hypothetical protein DEH69_20790 [Streptomyces sp. PT12]
MTGRMVPDSQRRVSFSQDLARLDPATDVERDAVRALLASIRAGADEDGIHAAKLRLRDALLLSTWQSPVRGSRHGSGTLQGPSYPSHYERETLDPDLLERLLSNDTREALLFRSVGCAREAHRYAADYIAAKQPARRDRLPIPEIESLRVLDQELGVLWLPATGADVLRHLAIDARKLGGAPTLIQLTSGYLDLEQLPTDSSWCVGQAPSGTTPADVRPVRLRSAQAASHGRHSVVEECERALAEAHRPFLAGIERVDCIVTSSGMSALGSILRQAELSGSSVLAGHSCYPENGKLLKYVSHRCDVRRIEEEHPLNGVFPGAAPDAPSAVVLLLEPVSNNASTAYVSEFTDWAPSKARDLAVCDVPSTIRELGKERGSGGGLVAVDASVPGPGPWLRRVAESAKESGVQVVVWSSLQKHFMVGEDWAPGGYLLTVVPDRCDPLFSSTQLRRTVDLAGAYEPALRLVARSADGAAARAERLGQAAAWIATELGRPALEVIHPARTDHPDHHAWVSLGRPAVPFVLLRLGPERAERVRNVLRAGSPDLPEIVQRGSFGFSEPTVTDIFPEQPDEIMRVSPGDPELVPPASVLRALRAALAAAGSETDPL